jgi:hypothetical protein
MERYLFVLIILFITVGLFITTTSKIKCENFNNDERELKVLNRNIDLINRSLNQITGFDNTLLNLIK